MLSTKEKLCLNKRCKDEISKELSQKKVFRIYLDNLDMGIQKLSKKIGVGECRLSDIISMGLQNNWANHKKMKA